MFHLLKSLHPKIPFLQDKKQYAELRIYEQIQYQRFSVWIRLFSIKKMYIAYI